MNVFNTGEALFERHLLGGSTELPIADGRIWAGEGHTPIEYTEEIGKTCLQLMEDDARRSAAHYQTPPAIAKFMAKCVPYASSCLRVLDPGSGSGILSAAVCEEAYASQMVDSLHVDAYEIDPLLADMTRRVLLFSKDWLSRRGIALTFDVKNEDFVIAHATALTSGVNASSPMPGMEGSGVTYDIVISNPPYFKIRKYDPRAVAGASAVYGQPNIYAMFMAMSAQLLSDNGHLVYIVPRSFASGPYFKKFREMFFQQVVPTTIHLFESRKDVFKKQTVLQENIIIAGRARPEDTELRGAQVTVSHSRGANDIPDSRTLAIDLDSILDSTSPRKELCIPTSAEDLQLAATIRAWPNTLHSLGLDVSTGPVVPFRSARLLVEVPMDAYDTAPLIWMHHVLPMKVEWPKAAASKPQWIKRTPNASRLLVGNHTYVLIRRFSAKEEKRRLVAAPLVQGCLNSDVLGLENHLNFIHGESRPLDEALANGISALLNSSFLDRYFRLFNGNTQVSATELRAIPLPEEVSIRAIGEQCCKQTGSIDHQKIDSVVSRTLDLPSW